MLNIFSELKETVAQIQETIWLVIQKLTLKFNCLVGEKCNRRHWQQRAAENII